MVAIALSLGLAAAAFATSTDFFEPVSSPETVGIGPSGIAAADFNGDGDLDLATSNISSGNVTVLRNGGVGNFVEPASSPEDAGSFPQGMAAGDVSGDGLADLVVANQESDDVNVLINTGTGGNFRERNSSPEAAGDTPVSVVLADVDGDFDRDVIVANALPTANVTILRNTGAGNFVQRATSPETAGNKPVSIAASDFDGDGDVDLAVANQQSFNVSLLANNGSGNFSELATSPESAGTFPQGVSAIDIEGDGDSDLAIANQGSNDVTILRNNGSANFSQPPTSPEPVGMRPLRPPAVADFDDDGDLDLAVTNADDDNVTILANRGTGNFLPASSSPEAAGDGAGSIAVGDLDGDGDRDLAIANAQASTVTILKNR
jgi:hypothetical protein